MPNQAPIEIPIANINFSNPGSSFQSFDRSEKDLFVIADNTPDRATVIEMANGEAALIPLQIRKNQIRQATKVPKLMRIIPQKRLLRSISCHFLTLFHRFLSYILIVRPTVLSYSALVVYVSG
jgi:hypothetical protein